MEMVPQQDHRKQLKRMLNENIANSISQQFTCMRIAKQRIAIVCNDRKEIGSASNKPSAIIRHAGQS